MGVAQMPPFTHEVSKGVRVSHVARVDQNLISVVSTVGEFKDDYLSEICKGAIDAVRTAVDMVSYASGMGWVTQLDFVVLPDGRLSPIGWDMRDIAGICTAYKINSNDPRDLKDFKSFYGTALKYPALSMAFADLIQAGTGFHIAAQNCGRVVDALRRLLASANPESRDDSWKLLRDVIKSDRAYLDFIMNLSKGPRHGDRTPVSGAENLECVKRTWIVMNRYLEYIKRDCQPLPDEFEELKG
jgi:hypothetical protein